MAAAWCRGVRKDGVVHTEDEVSVFFYIHSQVRSRQICGCSREANCSLHSRGLPIVKYPVQGDLRRLSHFIAHWLTGRWPRPVPPGPTISDDTYYTPLAPAPTFSSRLHVCTFRGGLALRVLGRHPPHPPPIAHSIMPRKEKKSGRPVTTYLPNGRKDYSYRSTWKHKFSRARNKAKRGGLTKAEMLIKYGRFPKKNEWWGPETNEREWKEKWIAENPPPS